VRRRYVGIRTQHSLAFQNAIIRLNVTSNKGVIKRFVSVFAAFFQNVLAPVLRTELNKALQTSKQNPILADIF